MNCVIVCMSTLHVSDEQQKRRLSYYENRLMLNQM